MDHGLSFQRKREVCCRTFVNTENASDNEKEEEEEKKYTCKTQIVRIHEQNRF